MDAVRATSARAAASGLLCSHRRGTRARVVAVAVDGESPGTVFDAMTDGSIGSTAAIVSTLNHTALTLTVAIGSCIASAPGLVNIGQEGQITIGGLAAPSVGLSFPFSGFSRS